MTQPSGILRPVGSIHFILPSGRQNTSLKHCTGVKTLALNGMVLGLCIGNLAFQACQSPNCRKIASGFLALLSMIELKSSPEYPLPRTHQVHNGVESVRLTLSSNWLEGSCVQGHLAHSPLCMAHQWLLCHEINILITQKGYAKYSCSMSTF